MARSIPSAAASCSIAGALSAAETKEAGGTAGESAVHHLREARPDRAVERQHHGEQISQLLRGGSDDVHAAAGVLMLVGEGEHLRIYARKDPGEDVGAEALEVLDPGAPQRARDPVAQRVRRLVAGPA